jgi:hypothetical protein
MKEKTLKLVNNKLVLLEKAVEEKNKLKCIEIYNSIPGTGFSYFIDEIVNRSLGRIEGALLLFNFE